MRTMFHRIGFTVAASQVIVDDQGMDSLEEIRLLSDDEVENLCKVIRRFGGTIPGPAPDAPPVNNPGTPVSLRAENHLKLLGILFEASGEVQQSDSSCRHHTRHDP